MVLVLGEILFDIFPDSRQMGGAPFNFAFHLKKLGLPVRFFSRTGDDELGKEIFNFLDKHGFDTNDIQVDMERPTGTVNVSQTQEGHSFSITTGTAWEALEPSSQLLECLAKSSLIYYGSMIWHAEKGRQTVQTLLKDKPSSTRIFCDINLRSEFYTHQEIKSMLSDIDILKLNSDELAEITKYLYGRPDSSENGAQKLIFDYDISEIILTLGSKGSQWITKSNSYRSDIAATTNLIDTVGAGDAYAAVCAGSRIAGIPIETAMDLASQFAGNICGIQGALPDSDDIYQDLLKKDI